MGAIREAASPRKTMETFLSGPGPGESGPRALHRQGGRQCPSWAEARQRGLGVAALVAVGVRAGGNGSPPQLAGREEQRCTTRPGRAGLLGTVRRRACRARLRLIMYLKSVTELAVDFRDVRAAMLSDPRGQLKVATEGGR